MNVKSSLREAVPLRGLHSTSELEQHWPQSEVLVAGLGPGARGCWYGCRRQTLVLHCVLHPQVHLPGAELAHGELRTPELPALLSCDGHRRSGGSNSLSVEGSAHLYTQPPSASSLDSPVGGGTLHGFAAQNLMSLKLGPKLGLITDKSVSKSKTSACTLATREFRACSNLAPRKRQQHL